MGSTLHWQGNSVSSQVFNFHVHRQRYRDPVLWTIYAPAGYRLDTALSYEQYIAAVEGQAKRGWPIIASIGVAAANISSHIPTPHLFFKMNAKRRCNLQTESEQAKCLRQCDGIIVDELTIARMKRGLAVARTCK